MWESTTKRRLIDGFTMLIVTSLSLLLLVYVAYAEGKRIYEQFQTEKLVAQGSIVQYSMENYLRAGLALRDYVGFNAMVEPMVGIDEIDGVGVYDDTGRQLFLVTDEKITRKIPEPSALVKRLGDEPSVDQSGATYYQIVLPLRSRFGTVGALVLYVPIAVIAQRLDESFRPLLYAAAGLSTLFAVMVALAGGASRELPNALASTRLRVNLSVHGGLRASDTAVPLFGRSAKQGQSVCIHTI